MKLSIDGLLRHAARAAFAGSLAAATFSVAAQTATGEVAATPNDAAAPTTAPEAAAPGEAPTGLPIAALPTAPPPRARTEKAVNLEAVQVTGSRIRSPNLTSVSPVTTINSAEIKYEGTTRVEDLINNLPQAFADQGGNVSNGSDGTATVNLRNLGPARTLVLIDGKRFQPGDPRSNVADLNFIPADLISRVDVVTGGASAVYGSDALAGVVNFIMKKDFQGVRVNYQHSIYQHDQDGKSTVTGPLQDRNFPYPKGDAYDGRGSDATFLMGVNLLDNKGNITAYGTYRHLDPITQDRRDFSACSLAEADEYNFACAGSSTTSPARFRKADPNTGAGFGPSYTLNSAPGAAPGTLRTYNGATDAFNFAPYNYYQRNDERYTLGSFAHYKFADAADVYSQLMFADDRTNAVIAPSGLFYGVPSNGVPYSTNCGNPYLSQQERTSFGCTSTATTERVSLLIGKRNVEGGARSDDIRHTQYRALVGIKGDFLTDFSYDLSVQYGTSILANRYLNDFSVTRARRAIDVVSVNGTPTCQAAVDRTDPTCVPYNIFANNAVDPAAINYIQQPGFSSGSTEEHVAVGTISGTLGQFGLISPFAKTAVGFALGAEYRREAGRYDVDTAFATGDLAGQGGPALGNGGNIIEKDVFTELRLPIWEGVPFGEDLSLEGGFRHSDYSSTESTETYKVGLNYAPTKDVKFRASYNRAVRAPNVSEQFSSTGVVLDGSSDPCSGATPDDTAAQCANDPVIRANPALYGNIEPSPANQYNGLGGSLDKLKPETSRSYSYGMVFTPTFIKNFNFSADFYRIKVKDLVGSFGFGNILDGCYSSGTNCDLIHRDAGGSLWQSPNGFVIDTTKNTGGLEVRGIDVTTNYKLMLSDIGLNDVGSVAFDLVGTYDILEQHQPFKGGDTYICQGRYGSEQCGTPVPQWRHKLRATWVTPWSGFTASAAWRYVAGVKADDITLPNDTNNLDRQLTPQNYLDLYTSVKLFKVLSLRAGVNNVLDNDPPIVGSGSLSAVFGNGNTYPQVYDALGRYLFAGAQVDF